MAEIFTRSKLNPILKADPNHNWEALKVYNPAAYHENGKYHLLYRAMGKNWVSRVGYANATDGENFTRDERLLIEPEYDYERQGIEDPRIVKIENTYYMTYAAYDGVTARLCIATSQDMKQWKKYGPIVKEWIYTNELTWEEYIHELIKQKFRIKKEWSKAGALFPEKIQDKYVLLFGDDRIHIAESDEGTRWSVQEGPFLVARKGSYFDNNFVEMGPPPLKTEQGWLVLYHGVNKQMVYSIGMLLLEYEDPTKIRYQSEQPLFWPSDPVELKGIVDILPGEYRKMQKMNKEELDAFINKMEQKRKMPHVTFCNGAVLVGDTLRIYYGASDSVICTATAKLDDILAGAKF